MSQHDGTTRSARTLNYLLQTPDTFVRTPLPTITGGTAIIHASPALGAGFLAYTVELEAGGILAPALHQRFVYLLEGEAELSLDRENYAEGAPYTHPLRAGAYAYLPPNSQGWLKAKESTRAVILEKKYTPLPGTRAPTAVFSHHDMIEPTHLNGDPNLLVHALLPADFAFDFAVNLMTYEDGAALSQVEVHVMEHGLLMLEGHGPYRLGDETHEVQDGDFIWMAPYCPQWFKAEGAGRARYLIYKDFNRVPAL